MSEIPVIVVIGVGSVGSRHFQSLCNLNFECEIYAVDPNDESLQTAQKYYESIGSSKNTPHYLKSIEELPKNIDVAIIATSSNLRLNILKSLINYGNVSNLILEKVLFQQTSEYHECLDLLEKNQIQTWVNTPMRIWPTFEKIKKEIDPKEPINITISSSDFGLGCNSIHYVDLLYFFTGNDDIEVDTNNLYPKLYDSKRIGYSEFYGKLTFTDSNKNELNITSYLEGEQPTYITISTIDKLYLIKAHTNKYWEINKSTDWNPVEFEFKLKYQSQMTDELIIAILNQQKVGIPTYSESMRLHLPFIRSLEEFLKSINNFHGLVPIT